MVSRLGTRLNEARDKAVRQWGRVGAKYLNPLIVRTAGSTRSPAALIKHTGRSSGRAYATPLRPYTTDGGFLIALGYGSDVDWVRNVLANGRAELVSRGVTYEVTEPQLIPIEEARAELPRREYPILVLMGTRDCLRLKASASR